jgi:L-malate glycosyltransferase
MNHPIAELENGRTVDPQTSPIRVLHVMQGVRVGGMEKGVLQQLSLARAAQHNDSLLLFDTPPNDPAWDYDMTDTPWQFLQRRPGFDWRYVAQLRRHLRLHRPHIVHAHNDTALCYAALALWGLPPTAPRLIGSFHNYPAHPSPRSRLLSRWAAGRCAVVTAVSHELAARLQHESWVSHIEVILNGIDTDQFQPTGPSANLRAALGCSNHTLLVGHIGRFDANKRQHDLVAAMQLMAPASLDVRLLMVGEGPLRTQVQAACGNDSRITLRPRVMDIPAWLRALDVFVLCSLHEGTSRALLEAMACARAVIATAVGGNCQLLRDDGEGPCGLLVPAQSPEALVRAIGTLAQSPQLRSEMGQRARRRVLASHTARATAGCYEERMAPLLR